MYCTGADGNTCERKSRGDEKQLTDLEWPNLQDFQMAYKTTYANIILGSFLQGRDPGVPLALILTKFANGKIVGISN